MGEELDYLYPDPEPVVKSKKHKKAAAKKHDKFEVDPALIQPARSLCEAAHELQKLDRKIDKETRELRKELRNNNEQHDRQVADAARLSGRIDKYARSIRTNLRAAFVSGGVAVGDLALFIATHGSGAFGIVELSVGVVSGSSVIIATTGAKVSSYRKTEYEAVQVVQARQIREFEEPDFEPLLQRQHDLQTKRDEAVWLVEAAQLEFKTAAKLDDDIDPLELARKIVDDAPRKALEGPAAEFGSEPTL